VSDQNDVRRVAGALPGAVEQGDGWRVGGRLFVWTYPERVHPKKPRVPNPEVLCVRVADEGEKRALLATDPEKFFTTPHYDGYPIVLVRLPAVGATELADLVLDAWRVRAPAVAVAAYDAAHA
jgi:hypothetical protein